VSSAPAGYRFPREVIAVAVRWYLRYGLSYRDVEELLAERDIEVDHVTVYRWVQAFTAEFINAARPARHAAGDRWFIDETYVKVAGRGLTSTARSTSTAKSSTSSFPNAVMPALHERSSPARSTLAPLRSRSPPTGHRSTPA
jgi:transposase-like protein